MGAGRDLAGLRKDGTSFPIEIGLDYTVIDGKPHALAFITDITERKQAEDALHVLNMELEQRVRDRTAQLEIRTKEMETFTYSVSHDLKAPLRGIDGYSRLLMEDYADRLDDDGKNFITTIRHAAVQMSQLIDDLLAYSRLERRTLELGSANLRNTAEAVVAEKTIEIEEHKAEIAMSIPDKIEVQADQDGLMIALRNLIDNAIKFAGKDAPPRIEIGGSETPTHAIIWVKDNGIGFDMKFHDRIFSIFQRLHRAEEYPGTGVGLAIVQKAMERMGGTARAESQPGKGATFFLELPK
jgi:light-regulated signal transduction histidine kinase (bacteriophytochrome)